MKSFQILFAFLLLAAPILSQTLLPPPPPPIDSVTIDITTLSEQFSQADLQSGSADAEAWGNDSSEFYSCSNLSNKYFSTISHTFTLSKTFTNLSDHNNVYITFDNVFLNIEKKFLGIQKNAKMDVDGSVQTFSAKVVSDKYGCMTHTTSTKVDGKNSASLLFSHSASSMTIKITPTDLGTVARLGVANMKIVTVKCGDNASFNSSQMKCTCNSGYEETLLSKPFNGDVQFESKCILV